MADKPFDKFWGKTKDCQSCLWASIECQNGSRFKEKEQKGKSDKACSNWAYYD